MLWWISWLTSRLTFWSEWRRRRARFREAVREYAYACAEEEFERTGYVGPPGSNLWAYDYMPAFLESLDDEAFEDFAEFSFPGDRAGTEDCFAWRFREGWREAPLNAASPRLSISRAVSGRAHFPDAR